jgi:hypothetical protein
MSTQGRPKCELLPLGETARSAKGVHKCTQGRRKCELLSLGGRRVAPRGYINEHD